MKATRILKSSDPDLKCHVLIMILGRMTSFHFTKYFSPDGRIFYFTFPNGAVNEFLNI